MNHKIFYLSFLFFLGSHFSFLQGMPLRIFETENFFEAVEQERRLTAIEKENPSSQRGEGLSQAIDPTVNGDDVPENLPAPVLTECSVSVVKKTQPLSSTFWQKLFKGAAFLSLIVSGKGETIQPIIPTACREAATTFEQASRFSQETTAACFNILNAFHENPTMGSHHEMQELTWEGLFQKAVAEKDHWMKVEEACQQKLSDHVEKDNDGHPYEQQLSASRMKQWVYPAHWHCSPVKPAFRENLDNHGFACVIDSLETDGPEAGQKIERKLLKLNGDYFPYMIIENVIDTTTGELIRHGDMIANEILITLKKGEDSELFLQRLTRLFHAHLEPADLDPHFSLSKGRYDWGDGDYYELTFSPMPIKLFLDILEECRRSALHCETNGVIHQGPWDRGYAGSLGRDYIPRCTFHLSENDPKQRTQTLCRNAFEAYRNSNHFSDVCSAKKNLDSDNEEEALRLEKHFQTKIADNEWWKEAEATCQQALEQTSEEFSSEHWWQEEQEAAESRKSSWLGDRDLWCYIPFSNEF